MKAKNLIAMSHYSMGHSSLTPEQIAKEAKELGYEGVSYLCPDNMFGVVDVYNECKKNGLKLNIGTRLDIKQEEGGTFNLDVWVRDTKGYNELSNLITNTSFKNAGSEVNSVPEHWLDMDADLSSLFFVDPCNENGFLVKAYKQMKEEGAVDKDVLIDIAKSFKDFFGENNYAIGLVRDGSSEHNEIIKTLAEVSTKAGVPCVVANHAAYSEKNGGLLAARALETVFSKGGTIFNSNDNPNVKKYERIMTPEEVETLFKDVPVVLENTNEAFDACKFEFSVGEHKLPVFTDEHGEQPEVLLDRAAHEGLNKRLIALYPDEAEREAKQEEYTQRLEYELDIIKGMGFASYYLIVQDFINWAKDHDIPIGPGRGSGAGSLVAYATRITDIDPLQYGLLFERFLNPERKSMPDFDVDMCAVGRQSIINYVSEKYGKDHVARISTFGTLGGKSALRAAMRMFAIPAPEINRLSDMVKIAPGVNTTLKEYIFGSEDGSVMGDDELQKLYNGDDKLKQALDVAFLLQDKIANRGMHAAGLVILPFQTSKLLPSAMAGASGDESALVAAYPEVELLGGVKFDFLGLNELTISKNIEQLVRAKTGNNNFTVSDIPLGDKETFEKVFHNGNSTAIFQFESGWMQQLLKQAKPNSVENLTDITSLARPGPMAYIPQYIENKENPEKVTYIHPALEPILKDTNGIFIYQEQVMTCAMKIAGYSLGKADLLRRAMGKKKPEEMKEHRAIFVDGAKKNGISEDIAMQIFDTMEKFAAYGFNKSHAVAYSMLSYHGAWFKTHHPTEFFAAHLQGNHLNSDKLAALVDDARENGVTVLPPDINRSNMEFAPETLRNDAVRYGLAGIKGVSEQVGLQIVQERNANGPFEDFKDFLDRTASFLNKTVIESLASAGALDSFVDGNRSLILDSDNVASAVKYVTKIRSFNALDDGEMLPAYLFNRAGGQEDVFAKPIEAPNAKTRRTKTNSEKMLEIEGLLEFLDTEKFKPIEKLELFEKERGVLGFYLTGNPMQEYYPLLKEHPSRAFYELKKLTDLDEIYDKEVDKNPEKRYVNMSTCGVILKVDVYPSKKAADITISDGKSVRNMLVLGEDKVKEFAKKHKEGQFIAVNASMNERYDERKAANTKSLFVNNSFNFDETIEKLKNNETFGNFKQKQGNNGRYQRKRSY